jgi:hypothetical protein
MALTETAIRALKPKAKAYKVADEKGPSIEAAKRLFRFLSQLRA